MASNEHNRQPATPHNSDSNAKPATNNHTESATNNPIEHAATSRTEPAAASHRHAQEWQDALATAQNIPAFARPSAKELDTLTTACTEPRQLNLLLEAFARHADTLLPPSAASQTNTGQQANALENQDKIAIPSSISPSQLPYALLCDYVDDSSHDLREWINALTVFSDWLREHNQPPQPLTMLLPYLSCSAEAQANSPMPLPLPHIVADMLELYGYEGS